MITARLRTDVVIKQTMSVSKDDSHSDGNEPQEGSRVSRQGGSASPFPYGVMDSAIPPPMAPESAEDAPSSLPLGAQPADPSLPAPAQREPVEPADHDRVPFTDPDLPEKLMKNHFEEVRSKETVHLPQGIQAEFDALLREVDEETAERPVVQASMVATLESDHAMPGDSRPEDDHATIPESHFVGQPSQENDGPSQAPPEPYATFGEESNTVVDREAPSYSTASPKKNWRRRSLLVAFTAIVLAAAVATWQWFGAYEGDARSPTGAAAEPNEIKPGESSATVTVPHEDSGKVSGDAHIPDTSVEAEEPALEEGAAETSDGDATNQPTAVGGTVELPEVPENIARLSPRERAREARKQLRLASRMFRGRRYDSALWHYDRALTFEPTSGVAARGKANVLLRLEHYDPALQWARYATEQDPKGVHSWNALGEAASKAGDQATAKSAYQKALALSPRNRVAKRALSRLSQ